MVVMMVKKTSMYFGVALILATSFFVAWIFFNNAGVPQRVEAIQGIAPDVPFRVDLTDTLTSLDLNHDGDPDDLGDFREVSGYTFTVQSETAFTAFNKMTVTFPDGIDLTGTAAGCQRCDR